MNKLATLIRVQIKDNLSRYAQQLNVRNKWLIRLVMVLPLLILLPLVQMVWLIAEGFGAIGQPELTMTYVYVACVLLMFVTALPLVVSIFFYSRDLALLASLPLKGRTIVFSKLASVYFYLLTMSAAFLGSSLVIYLIQAGFSLPQLLLGLLSIFLAPVLPMILATLLILPFMSLVGGRSNRNSLIILGNLLILGIFIALEVFISRTAMNPQELVALLSQKDGLLQLVGRGFPPAIWMTKMILGSWTDGLLFLALGAGALGIIGLLSGFLYNRSLLNYNQAGSRATKEKIRYRKGRLQVVLLRRHLGVIFSNPTFMLNSLLTIFVPVLIFVLYNLIGVMDLDTLKSPMLEPFRLYIYTGILLSPSIMGSLSATVISREGRSFWETRVLPISFKDNLKARMNSTLLLTGLGELAVGILALLVIPVGWKGILLAMFATAAGTFALSAVDLIINVQRPMLQWTNPTAAVKNNLNVMLSLASRVVLGALIYGLYRLAELMGFGQDPELHVLLAGIVLLIIWLIARSLLYGPYTEKFRRIEL